ncbi:MAG: nuclear transport factor 2 family protein, partial [Actinomycetota bacterium]
MVSGVGDDTGVAEALDLARRYLRAIGSADVEGARACFHPEAQIWHNFDDVTQTVEDNLALMAWMADRFPERDYRVHRLEPIAGGYLQQHTLEVRT